MNNDTPLTPQEVANLLKISKSTVYELIKQNKINSYKVGKKLRIDLKDVSEFKNKSKSLATGNNDNLSGEIEHHSLIGTLNNVNTPLIGTVNNNYKRPFIICGQDMILDILSRYLQIHPNGGPNLRSYQGSYNSLFSLYNDQATLATAHMWDGKTEEYNVSFVEKMLPGTACMIINLAYRNQGFYVLQGNPKNIVSWDDITRPDISIINREKGSGTRILVDEYLRKNKISPSIIQGYEKEGLSHSAVASAVARGESDYGVGIEKVSYQVKGIQFIPLQREQYDLVIKKEDLKLPSIQAVLSIIKSKEFRDEISGLGGYDVSNMGEIIAET